MQKSKGKKRVIISLWAILTFVILMVIGAVVYVNDDYKGNESAIMALKDSAEVEVTETKDYYSFVHQDSDTGFIFYPGGKVESMAYAPLMHALAKEKITVLLMKMPFNLAVLKPQAAEGIAEQFQGIKDWYMGGHSLGGAMSASYIKDHTSEYKGLVLMGAYPTKDLTDSGLSVLSIYGSEDKILNQERFNESKVYLPKETVFFEIQGGNHGYFGNYGEQENDGKAQITPEEQQRQVILAIVEWINKTSRE